MLRKFTTTTTNSYFGCIAASFCLKPNSIRKKRQGQVQAYIITITADLFSFVSHLFTPTARIKKSCGSVFISQLQFGHLHCLQSSMHTVQNAALHL